MGQFINYKNWVKSFKHDQGWSQAHKYRTLKFVDMNGDGLTDVCSKASGGVVCSENTGRSSFVPYSGIGTSGADFDNDDGWGASKLYSTLRFVDVTGDGIPDLCGRDTTGIVCAKNKILPHSRMSSIETLGSKVEIEYEPLTNNSVYSKQSGSNGANGIFQVAYPAYVVSAASTNNGIGGLRTTNYQYKGLRYHAAARRSLGFYSITSTDLMTGNVLFRKFSQDYANRSQGMLIHRSQTASNGQMIGRSDIAISANDECGTGDSLRFNPRLSTCLLYTSDAADE